jgi:CRISPR/Cas system CMR-associated protein Cmr1 (group 7 of RAMP superfamily)
MDIVERLRKDSRGPALEAADEIEKLRWENANMEKLWGKSEGTWMEIRDKQDAKIERLRKVVTLLIEYEEHDENIYKGAVMWEALIEAAHAALKDKQ